jgi:hypothetical protein
MKLEMLKLRAGYRRSAVRGTLVLVLGAAALSAAKTMRADTSHDGWITRAADGAAGSDPAQEAQHAAALIAGMRGASPIACRLATRSLQNGWGRGGFVGPESIGEAGDAVFDWAVSREISAATIPQLRGYLADPDACVRHTAAALLGRTRVNSVADELRSELSRANAATREAALLAVGYAGKKADAQAASALLKDAEPAVKLASIWALGMIGDTRSVQPLIAILKDSDAAMRASAAFALGQIESADAIPALASLLGSDTDARVRRAAAAALGQIE